jgi:hypothetical protein
MANIKNVDISNRELLPMSFNCEEPSFFNNPQKINRMKQFAVDNHIITRAELSLPIDTIKLCKQVNTKLDELTIRRYNILKDRERRQSMIAPTSTPTSISSSSPRIFQSQSIGRKKTPAPSSSSSPSPRIKLQQSSTKTRTPYSPSPSPFPSSRSPMPQIQMSQKKKKSQQKFVKPEYRSAYTEYGRSESSRNSQNWFDFDKKTPTKEFNDKFCRCVHQRNVLNLFSGDNFPDVAENVDTCLDIGVGILKSASIGERHRDSTSLLQNRRFIEGVNNIRSNPQKAMTSCKNHARYDQMNPIDLYTLIKASPPSSATESKSLQLQIPLFEQVITDPEKYRKILENNIILNSNSPPPSSNFPPMPKLEKVCSGCLNNIENCQC